MLLINYEYPPIGGGAATATLHVARAIARQGHHVTVLTTEWRKAGDRSEPNIRVVSIPCGRQRHDRSRLVEQLVFTIKAMFRFRRSPGGARSFDGTIAFFTIPSGIISWWLRRRLSTPYVISLRGADVPGLVPEIGWIHSIVAPLRRAVLRKATGVVANGPSLKRLCEDHDGISPDLLCNGVDSTFYCPKRKNRQGDPFRILFVGRLHPQKNLALLLQQFAGLIQRGIRSELHIVGEGHERTMLDSLSAKLELKDSIIWHGWLESGDILDQYQAADCAVNPSLYEGVPNTVLEAMSCGLPVVASDIDGNNTLIENDRTGRLFPLTDPNGLGRALYDLATDPSSRKALGDAAREEALLRDWERVAKKLLSYFK